MTHTGHSILTVIMNRLMRFKKDELAIFNPDGTLKDDAMISFAIRTPFCDKIISYTKAELEQVEE
mgnify:CR=1 FL=1